MTNFDVIVIGAGAAGLMTAIEAGKRGRRVLLLEHSEKIGEKIRISGGGRCNFTNLGASPQNYLSDNPHFVKSALSRYTQHDFIKLVESHNIPYHEKTLGQLFCDGSSKQIIGMLLDQCHRHSVRIQKGCHVSFVKNEGHFFLETNLGIFESESLVIACGGLSIPQIGASDFGYRIAKQFGHSLVPVRPALVPLTVQESLKKSFSQLSGLSNYSRVHYGKKSFLENILFTHRGLSGPAILQISSYLPSFRGEEIDLDLLPSKDLRQLFTQDKNSKQYLMTYLKAHLSNRLVEYLASVFSEQDIFQRPITEIKKEVLFKLATLIHSFKVPIEGSEGYQKAEVTVGGVQTRELSSKTMASLKVSNLYFVGEVVDVTGWLGGYNFQWAWSSGYAAGQYC